MGALYAGPIAQVEILQTNLRFGDAHLNKPPAGLHVELSSVGKNQYLQPSSERIHYDLPRDGFLARASGRDGHKASI